MVHDGAYSGGEALSLDPLYASSESSSSYKEHSVWFQQHAQGNIDVEAEGLLTV
jgi:hypothetical protein